MTMRRLSGHARRPMSPLAVAAVALLGVAGTTPARSAESPFPALVEPPNQQRHVGKVVFAELVTPDVAAAKQFYGSLFGWTFRDAKVGAGQFAQALLDGVPVAELAQHSIAASKVANSTPSSAWLTFIVVGDVDAAVPAAAKAGAKVLYPPHTIANFGREAILLDPQGAVFVLVTSSSGDPADTLAKRGAWIWSSLVTSDPDSGAAFYQNLLGYDVFDLPDDPKGQHLILASEDFARASVNSLPTNRPAVHPLWLDYVRVDDAEAMVARVQSLGGRVIVPPHLDRHGGKVTVVADPSGAPFGLMEWQDDAGSRSASAGKSK